MALTSTFWWALILNNKHAMKKICSYLPKQSIPKEGEWFESADFQPFVAVSLFYGCQFANH
jgi:hypothetical protein